MNVTVSPLSGYSHNNEVNVQIDDLSGFGTISWKPESTLVIESDGVYTLSYDEWAPYDILIESCGFSVLSSVDIFPLFYPNVYIFDYDISRVAGCSISISFSAFSFEEINTFTFFASGSNSGFYVNPPTFWSHLNPQWRFLDSDDNVITSLTLTGSPVYDSDIIVGYEMSANIFYIDDLPGSPNILITKS